MKFCSIIFLLLPLTCMTQSHWNNNSAFGGAISSYYLIDAESNQVLAKHNEDILLNPASTMKVITSISFLDKFGEDYTFSTTIGYNGNLKDHTLYGDLVIYGNGDPALGSKRFQTWNSSQVLDFIYQKLTQNGIHCIQGKIIVDASFYGSDCTPGSWDYNDLGNYYAAGTWSTNFNENRYTVDLIRSQHKGASVAIRSIDPKVPDFKLMSALTLDAANTGDQAYIYNAPYQHQGVIRGTIPVGNKDFRIHGAVPNGPLFFASQLSNYLSKQGIFHDGIEYSFSKIKTTQKIGTIPSQTAYDLVKMAIAKSINLYCESFLKHMGNGNREKGIELILDGIENENVQAQFDDGSGLSQRNLITARQLSLFLKKAYQSRPQIKSLLARSGYDGTLKYKFATPSLKGRVYGKSGSMQGVQAYTGILMTSHGKELIFTVMINHYTAKDKVIYADIEKLVSSWYQKY